MLGTGDCCDSKRRGYFEISGASGDSIVKLSAPSSKLSAKAVGEKSRACVALAGKPRGLPNSPYFHEIAILLQSRAAIVGSFALLTGRVFEDGLGGLRAVLLFFRLSAPGSRFPALGFRFTALRLPALAFRLSASSSACWCDVSEFSRERSGKLCRIGCGRVFREARFLRPLQSFPSAASPSSD